MTRLAVFVDVQNVYYTVRQAHGCQFNYRELWRELTEQGEIVAAFAYAIERNDPKQRGFQQLLRDIGFEVKLKPFIQRSDGSAKGDWDVGIALDVVEYAEQVDRVILVSGDGDFDLLLQRIQQRFNCPATVYGTRALTASSLSDAADRFRAIEGQLLLQPPRKPST